MQNQQQSSISIRISLLDVMYGAVAGYGFSSFDELLKAHDPVSYALFVFSYVIMAADWLYSHDKYGSNGYELDTLMLDIFGVFCMSRLIHESASASPTYVGWLALLFADYSLWDLAPSIKGALRRFGTPLTYDDSHGSWWTFSKWDVFAAVAFVLLFLILTYGAVSRVGLPLVLGLVFIAVVAMRDWFVPWGGEKAHEGEDVSEKDAVRAEQVKG